MIIAVDAAGGEYAPHEIVKGAVKAAQEYKVDIALVGNKSMLHVLASRYLKNMNISIVEANEVIGYQESPVKAIRSKPNSPIVVGINMLRDGVASAFVSAGNTGAVFAAALFNLGKIEGIERPAICSLLDITPAEPVLLIDAGANADCRPSHLVQFARLGAIYSELIIGTTNPRIGLLSNGEEDTKGNQLVKATHRLLKKTNLNFIGNIEGQDIPKMKADVIVTDGFTGNIVIKTVEGLGDTFVNSLRQVGHLFANAYRFQGRALLRDIGIARQVDYREYGGACLLGINGNVIISHGRSQAKAIKNAIGLAKQTAERGIISTIKEGTNE
ncbi:phosphate acyltransferase PlsX [Chloroflexota bacterium]